MKKALEIYRATLHEIEEAGTKKEERILTTPQGARVDTPGAPGLVSLCSNNYLNLANHPEILSAAKASYDRWGYGLSSVRFICGTQGIHKELEARISSFVGMEDAVLYSSCYDANGGLFETLLGPQDAVISDELNHASLIDGIRLCKARRFVYANSDMQALKERLREAAGARIRLVVTDGVFSMDGSIANLTEICSLAEEHDALVMVDDSHATGLMGKRGRGTHEYCGVMGRVDILTGTFGKALGGASGGFTASSRAVTDLLRQRSRPYLFSNTLAPAICAATVKALELLERDSVLRDRLHENASAFRKSLNEHGFDIIGDGHPIIPVMLYDAHAAGEIARRMLAKGCYVVSFSYPVVPEGKARIRTQVSAAHTAEDLTFAAHCFAQAREEMNAHG